MDQIDHEDRVLLAGALSYLRHAGIQADEPSYQSPEYWSFPITETIVLPVASGAGWTTLVTVEAFDDYQVIIREYVATVVGGLPASGIQFRFAFDEATAQEGFSLTEGVDRHQNSLTPPYLRQQGVGVLTGCDVLKLQVNNTTGVQQQVAGGLFGWQYYDPDSPAERSVVHHPDAEAL